jgi:hypothetical protein
LKEDLPRQRKWSKCKETEMERAGWLGHIGGKKIELSSGRQRSGWKRE